MTKGMSDKKRKTTTKRSSRPIAAHRLFPVMTALWCAALLGLVCAILPAEVLGRIAAATGLPHLIAAAAPPLGFTARVLATVAMAGLGALLGLLVGLRLAARHRLPEGVAPPQATPRREADAPRGAADAPRVRARDAHPDAPPRRPLVVSDDMIDDAETQILDDSPVFGRRLAVDAGFDPFAIYESDAAEAAPFAPPAFLADALAREPAADGVGEIATPALAEPASAVIGIEPEIVEPAIVVETPAAIAPEPIEDETAHDQAEVEPAAPIASAPPAPSLFATAGALPEEGARTVLARADVDGMGLVQLVERLALAIAEHRAALDVAVQESAEASDPVLPPSPASDAAPVMPAPSPMPEMRQPAAAESAAVVELPRLLRPISAVDTTGETEAALEDRYSSLLDMAAAVRRIDTARATRQPVVMFPGTARDSVVRDAIGAAERPHLAAVPSHRDAGDEASAGEPRDAERTEQALRDALATLQRMTANR